RARSTAAGRRKWFAAISPWRRRGSRTSQGDRLVGRFLRRGESGQQCRQSGAVLTVALPSDGSRPDRQRPRFDRTGRVAAIGGQSREASVRGSRGQAIGDEDAEFPPRPTDADAPLRGGEVKSRKRPR